MSASNEEPETISLYDMVDDESEINEDQNDVDLSLNDSNQPFACNRHLEPCLNMVFDKLEDAKACYNAYARRKGFGIRVNHTRKTKNDRILVGIEYVCSKEGFRRRRDEDIERIGLERAETRVGCKAMIGLKKIEDTWVVCKFVEDHNHELLTPKSTSMLRGHRAITNAQRNLIDTLNETGIPPSKIMSVLSKESGGDYNVGCIPVDIQNYLGNKRRKLLQDGDAQGMYKYFIEQQCKNPGFVYAVEVDENGCMGNCFWADARSRIAYQYFGDVVTFDATYQTNTYKMPFVPFTGVNHHHQSVMFGCALLVNETTESYTWLLKTWLNAMLGNPPSTIITDDDKAMAKAIANVLPNVTHRLCMWHILQKVPDQLSHIYNKYPYFQGEFHHCIHDTLTIEEFELGWSKIMENYGLGDNDWLGNLYMRREKWVPAYLRRKFCAGMSTTQRSESMNKFFKDYVRSSTTISDFVYQYEQALNARYLKEKEQDVKTKNSVPILKTCYKIEVEAAKVYTRKMFMKFQEELFCSQKYKASKYCEEGVKKIYKVVAHGKESPFYEVSLDTVETKAICTCHMFEFVGIICRHILAVFVKKSLVHFFPSHYILERWTINAKKRIVHEISGDVVQVEPQISSTLMRNSLMLQFLEVAEAASQSEKKYKHLGQTLQKVHEELLGMQDVCDVDDSGSPDNTTLNNQVLSNLPIALRDPPHVPSKGRPKALRQKHPREKQLTKKRKCSICKETGHMRSNCPSHKHSREVANTSLTPHWELMHQQSQTEESSIARLNPSVIANTLHSTSFVQDSLPAATYPSTSSSSTMHIHPNQSSFTDLLQQFQES
ncbi:protein FAR1-RELATED SEQUENCE 5-like [Quercus robur]|uniref:protein FAR1-RELATED SEQUENCE 5-like n=1 Tax=Quercus robur TaxID=38942 RepID=UPI002161B9F2|nr:protein FAR1-RELATED SEQUENCE 5-like [Quercus robur]